MYSNKNYHCQNLYKEFMYHSETSIYHDREKLKKKKERKKTVTESKLLLDGLINYYSCYVYFKGDTFLQSLLYPTKKANELKFVISRIFHMP
jgi:hypothetical protein